MPATALLHLVSVGLVKPQAAADRMCDHHKYLCRAPGFVAGAAKTVWSNSTSVLMDRPCRTFQGARLCGIEWEQWLMADAFVHPSDVVIEYGARYGTTMCQLAAATNNSGFVVSVEPDQRAHRALLRNREANACNTHIMLGSVNDRPIAMTTRRNTDYDAMSSEAKPEGPPPVPNMPYTDVERRIGARFNAAVIDCEGCIAMVLSQQGLLAQLDLLMIEEDMPWTVSYTLWHAKLRAAGFEIRWRLRDTMFRYNPNHATWSAQTYYSVWIRKGSSRPRGPSCEEYARGHPWLYPFHEHARLNSREEVSKKFRGKSGIDCVAPRTGLEPSHKRP